MSEAGSGEYDPASRKQNVQAVRQEIRSYIQNERDTVLKKMLALKESIKSEDRRRFEFMDRKLKHDTKALPINVLKFIGTMKKAVHKTMRDKGGTPYSIIRSLFLYWDADKSGQMSGVELLACMTSLGVKVTLDNCQEIVKYYNKGVGEEMDYREFLNDINEGEPNVISFVSEEEEKARETQEIRFEEVADAFIAMPPVVKKFIEAVKNYIAVTMRTEGGTPEQHVRFLFQFYDCDYSNGLQADEIAKAAQRKMKLNVTKENAEEIVKFYDRRNTGEMSYDAFAADVCAGVKPILTFTDLTPRGIAAAKASLAANPFVPKPFLAPANKILERFKRETKLALINKVNKLGGTVSSWIREAFVTWDPYFTRKISDWRNLQGAAKRLGVTITEEEAAVLMKCYDRFNTGEMHYMFLAKEIMEEDAHFLQFYSVHDDVKKNLTGRTPAKVLSCLNKIKSAVDCFIRKSKGKLDGRHLLHGTCARFDPTKSGRIDLHGFQRVLSELRCSFSDESAMILAMKWFDTNGSQLLDYNEMCRQLYGDDVMVEKLSLPPLRETLRGSSSMDYGTMAEIAASSTSSLSATNAAEFGVNTKTKEKNLNKIESQSAKQARVKHMREKIIGERTKLIRKLAVIESQRQAIVEDYRSRSKKK